MDLVWSAGYKVTILMIEYIYKILENFFVVTKRTAAQPFPGTSRGISRKSAGGTGSDVSPCGGASNVSVTARM